MRTIRQLVPAWRRVTRTYGGTNPRTYITVHQTGNTNRGAGAQAHANLQSRGNARTASWHWQVDDSVAIQSYPDTARCWHSGRGKDGGNMSSIAVEICVNSDGDYRQTLANAAELVRNLMREHGIPISRVVQHNRWSGKHCPSQIRSGKDGIDWNDFLNMVVSGAKPAPSKPAPVSTSKPRPSRALEVDGWWGSSTTKRLQQVLGTTADGFVSSQSKHWRSSNPGLTSGWQWVDSPRGSRVIAAMQRRLKVKADGLIGPATINALSKRYGIKGDGHIDSPSLTVRAMQRALNQNRF